VEQRGKGRVVLIQTNQVKKEGKTINHLKREPIDQEEEAESLRKKREMDRFTSLIQSGSARRKSNITSTASKGPNLQIRIKEEKAEEEHRIGDIFPLEDGGKG